MNQNARWNSEMYHFVVFCSWLCCEIRSYSRDWTWCGANPLHVLTRGIAFGGQMGSAHCSLAGEVRGAVIFWIECWLVRDDGLAARCASWRDRPCTYNVTLWRVGVTIVVVEKRCYIFWVCVVALSIQHAMRVRHIAIRDLSRSTIFFHNISQTAWFSGGKKAIQQEMGFDYLYSFFLKHFWLWEEFSQILS